MRLVWGVVFVALCRAYMTSPIRVLSLYDSTEPEQLDGVQYGICVYIDTTGK